MHCNVRPSDVAPPFLGFHYEAHNANRFNNSAAPSTPSPTVNHRVKF